jgi:hypothetical protein
MLKDEIKKKHQLKKDKKNNVNPPNSCHELWDLANHV